MPSFEQAPCLSIVRQSPRKSSPTARRQEKRYIAEGELILIRGLPGSGKSTMAKELALAGYKHFEADMFFEVNGVYRYEASRIRDAHGWCQQMTRQALSNGRNVVVSNTFTQLREMEPYHLMTGKVRVIEASGTWQNLHGVPVEILKRMAMRWEQLPGKVSTHTFENLNQVNRRGVTSKFRSEVHQTFHSKC